MRIHKDLSDNNELQRSILANMRRIQMIEAEKRATREAQRAEREAKKNQKEAK